jgi:hypothetical protein
MTAHLGEDGQPCALHSELSTQRLYELALLGSRMPTFHHDAASKLQSLMMALDELSELSAEQDGAMQPAIDTAQMSLRELHQLLTTNRALSKPPVRAIVQVADVIQGAAERVGVRLRGDLHTARPEVRVAIPALTHAFAQLLDVAAGPSQLGRVVDLTIETSHGVSVTISGPREAAKAAPNTLEAVALAAFVLAREQGSLVCGGEGERFRIQLPAP